MSETRWIFLLKNIEAPVVRHMVHYIRITFKNAFIEDYSKSGIPHQQIYIFSGVHHKH